MRRGFVAVGTALFVLSAGPALACGGLVAPNGGIALVRTSTLAAYVDGVEHYVTRFEFEGAEESFGSITPLPDVPTNVERGGRWTLERLFLETQPPVAEDALFERAQVAASAGVEILEQKQIGALDITVLRGGGFAVGTWAEENGFSLSPDAPEVLDFYAARSPVFMAARFDVEEAERRERQGRGAGVAIHLTIPTDDPWVPLRILSLGLGREAVVEADVYLLTEREPALLPGPPGTRSRVVRDGLTLARSEPASPSLLEDLRSDRGMEWLPADDVWLTYLQLAERAADLTYDLAIDASGAGAPSPADAGLLIPVSDREPWSVPWPVAVAAGAALMAAILVALAERSRVRWA